MVSKRNCLAICSTEHWLKIVGNNWPAPSSAKIKCKYMYWRLLTESHCGDKLLWEQLHWDLRDYITSLISLSNPEIDFSTRMLMAVFGKAVADKRWNVNHRLWQLLARYQPFRNRSMSKQSRTQWVGPRQLNDRKIAWLIPPTFVTSDFCYICFIWSWRWHWCWSDVVRCKSLHLLSSHKICLGTNQCVCFDVPAKSDCAVRRPPAYFEKVTLCCNRSENIRPTWSNCDA